MHNDKQITPGFDVWSLGVTIHTMLTGTYPWPKEITRRGLPPFIYYITTRLQEEGLKLDNFLLLKNPSNKILVELIGRTLRIDPNQRPTIEDILQYKFFDLSSYENDSGDDTSDQNPTYLKLCKLSKGEAVTRTITLTSSEFDAENHDEEKEKESPYSDYFMKNGDKPSELPQMITPHMKATVKAQ